jgi:uncharacterized OsmC-like protein
MPSASGPGPMTDPQIKELFGRKARALAQRPDIGRANGHALIRLGAAGFDCQVEHEDRTVRVDQPPSEGGTGSAPHPGQLLRAALGSCLAIGYRLWGARLDVRIEAVTVEVVCEYDTRGQLGVAADVAVGWQTVRFDVTITSAAPRSAVEQVVATADRLNPMLANLAGTIRRVHRLHVEAPQTVAGGTERPVPL